MKSSLRTRLLIAFAAIALSGILGVTVSVNVFLEATFSNYAKERIYTDGEATLSTLVESWNISGAWNTEALSVIGMNRLSNGYILRLVDTDGTVIWDARSHNNGMCEYILATIAGNMASRYPGWHGSYEETPYTVDWNGKALGTAWIGFYGPFFYSEPDLLFLGTFNRIVGITALLALVVASISGTLMARWLSVPLRSITETAHLLRTRGFGVRMDTRSGIREISDLAASINSLAGSLDEQEVLRRRLTADISHELRTPLTALRGSIEAMLDGVWPIDKQRLESCRDEAIRISRLVERVEDLSRAENDLLPVVLGAVDVHRSVARICSAFEPECRRKTIHLAWDAPSETVTTDGDKLSQIMMNVVSNAVKYTEPGGTITVRATTRDTAPEGFTSVVSGNRYLVIETQDTGIGIPEADIPHVFERFYRVDTSRSQKNGGAGIGLSIALSIARQLGGSIRIDSEEGVGTVCTVSLPIVR